MPISQKIGWRAYVSPLSSLLTSIYGVWNAETTATTLATSIYGAWTGETRYTSLDSGVISAYNAENNANDSKGSNHGVLMFGATFSTLGKIGSSFYCDGIDDYVQFPNNSLNFTGDFSISMWVQVNYIGTWSNYIYPIHNLTSDASGKYYGYRLYLNGNSYVFDIGNGTTTLDRILFNCGSDVESQIAPTTGDVWKHIVITRKSGQVTKMYIGGNPITAEPTAPASNTSLKAQSTSTLDPVYQTTHTPYLGRWSNTVTKVDGLTFWNRVLTYTEISRLYNYDMSINYYGNVSSGVYYYKGNGLQYPFSTQEFPSADDSVSTNNGTIVGGVTYTPGPVGNAFTFNGTTGYVSLPNNTASLTGDFSVSLWVNLTSLTGHQFLFNNANISSAQYRGFAIVKNNTTNLIDVQFYNSNTGTDLFSTTAIAANSWYHIVVTRKVGVGTKLYINGSLNNSNTSVMDPNYYASQFCQIGVYKPDASTLNYFTNGKIDATTIWNKQLTDDEIIQLYNIGGGIQYPFTTQTIKTPYSVYNGDNLIDPIGAKNATIVGGVTYSVGKIGNAYTFDGSTGYLTLPVGSLNLAGSFSFSMWLKFNGTPSGYNTIISNLLTGNYRGFQLAVISGNLYIQLGNGSGLWVELQGPTVSEFTNKWGLITFVWEQGVGMKFYLNGVLHNSVANTTTLSYTGITAAPMIGKRVEGGWSLLNGSIDGLTFWNSALTPPEILTMFNDGTGMEYPYSSSIPAKLPSFNDVVGIGHGTSPSGSAPTFTGGKVGKAYNFDGINDYVELPSNSLNSLTNNFSISMWVKWGRNNISQILIANLNTNYGLGFFVEHAAGQLRFKGYKSAATNAFYVVKNSYTPTLGIWYHYTFTHKDQVNNIYENGVLIASDTTTTGHINHGVTNWPTIGVNKYNSTSIQEPFLGAIDMVNIWSKELSATEVTTLYNSGTGKQYPSY